LTVKAIIFDLDNCLAPVGQMSRATIATLQDAIRESNRGTLSEEQLEAALADCWRHSLDWVAETHGFSEQMREAGWRAGAQLEVTGRMHGYPDLSVLRELNVQRFLVTSGFRRLQESKIRALAFGDTFEAVYVDAIDEPDRIGKEGIFRKILEQYHLSPEEVLVVGDNPDSEIAAGNRVGIPAVQILRDGVPRGTNAKYYISGLEELKGLLKRSSVQGDQGSTGLQEREP
jgi:FMN phosphatase YigB (HAD superfamily)